MKQTLEVTFFRVCSYNTSRQEILLEALYNNRIRVVREYFDKYMHVELRSDDIEHVGLKSVMQLLAEKDIKSAEILLKQLRLNVNEKLNEICFYTQSDQLRNLLIDVLYERRFLNEAEIQTINYAKRIQIEYATAISSQEADILEK